MSWDIFVQDLPANAKAVQEIPRDFQPGPIGKRQAIIDAILDVAPNVDFTNPTWGSIEGDDWSIEVNIGEEDECSGFAFHVRGGDEAAKVVAAILAKLRLRALDSQTGDFFEANEAVNSLQSWRTYRNRIY